MDSNQKLWVCWCKKDDYDIVYDIVDSVRNRRDAQAKVERAVQNYQAAYNTTLIKKTELRYDHPDVDRMLVFMAGPVVVNA